MTFSELYEHVIHLQLLGEGKLQGLHDLIGHAACADGQAAEVGVYKGGTSLFMALAMPSRTLYAYDTFTGMPVYDASIDVHQRGGFADCSLDAFQSLLSYHNAGNVVIRNGEFPGSIREERDEVFGFVHLDGDQYQTTRDALEFFYPRMSHGGIIVLDDYGWPHCPGVAKAVAEFLSDKVEHVEHSGFSRFQAYIVKGRQ
jgi:hypothetical protein